MQTINPFITFSTSVLFCPWSSLHITNLLSVSGLRLGDSSGIPNEIHKILHYSPSQTHSALTDSETA
jgi:hypothetical protein